MSGVPPTPAQAHPPPIQPPPAGPPPPAAAATQGAAPAPGRRRGRFPEDAPLRNAIIAFIVAAIVVLIILSVPHKSHRKVLRN